MIEFDAKKLSVEKIYVKSIRSNGLVSYYANLDDFRKKKSPHTLRIPINETNLGLREKSAAYLTPRLSFFHKYDGNVLYLNLFRGARFSYENGIAREKTYDEFKAEMEKFIKENESRLEKLSESLKEAFKDNPLFFDGKYIFDLKNSKVNNAEEKDENFGKFLVLDENKTFLLGGYNTIGIKPNDDEIYKTKKRYVMIFRIKDNNKKEHRIYFPSMRMIPDVAHKKFENLEQEYFVNLRFLTKTINSLSKHFEYQEMEILDVERVMLDLGILSMRSIPDETLDFYNYSDKVSSMLAWFARLISKSETMVQLKLIDKLYTQLIKTDKERDLESNTAFLSKSFLTSYKDVRGLRENNKKQELVDISRYVGYSKTIKKEIGDENSLLEKIMREIEMEDNTGSKKIIKELERY